MDKKILSLFGDFKEKRWRKNEVYLYRKGFDC